MRSAQSRLQRNEYGKAYYRKRKAARLKRLETLQNLQACCQGLSELAYRLRKRRRPKGKKVPISYEEFEERTAYWVGHLRHRSALERERNRLEHEYWVSGMKGEAKHGSDSEAIAGPGLGWESFC